MFSSFPKESSAVPDNTNFKSIYSKLQNFLGRATLGYTEIKEGNIMLSARASTVGSDDTFITPVSSVGDLLSLSPKQDITAHGEVTSDLITGDYNSICDVTIEEMPNFEDNTYIDEAGLDYLVKCGDSNRHNIRDRGEIDILWCFDKAETLSKFVTTCDSDHNEGYSTCKLEISTAGRALFHGHLDTRVPKDGRIKTAGYAAMRSIRLRKSFKRATTYDWHIYNTLVLKVRGDGRSYLLNISCEGYHDLTWNDIYHYVLYTRGGPYWQLAKIPFSKFVLGSKGRLQDKQTRFRFDRVTHFGISCGDKIEGQYRLEVEYVGLEFDPTHEEEFAYEMYKTDKYIVGV